MCDVLKERDFQNEIKNRKKEIQEDGEKRWYEIQEQQLQDYDMQEYAKREEERLKKEDQMNMINEQFSEYKIKIIKEYQDRVIEGEIIKEKAKAAVEEEKY
jgi:hypothetical protein